MESLNVKKLGMNGMLVDLKEFKADKQETVKRWISRENYSQFKMELDNYENERVTIFLHGAKLGYEMDKDDVMIIIDCLMQDDCNVFCEQGEEGNYNFYLESRLIYCVDLNLI